MTPLVASCSVGESNVRFSGWALSPPLTEVRHGTTWELGLTREEKDLVVDRDWRGGRENGGGLSPERRRQLPLKADRLTSADSITIRAPTRLLTFKD